MAISPIQTGGFLQQNRRKQVQRDIVNFGVRTGQKFSDIAKSNILTESLVQERRDRDEANRFLIAKNEQLSREQFREQTLGFERQDRATGRDLRKAEEGRRRAVGIGVIGGFLLGGPQGASIGAAVGGFFGK